MRQTEIETPPKPPPKEFEPHRVLEAAFADETVRNELLAWAKRRVGNAHSMLAEDLVQDGCQRAWKKASTYDPSRSTPTQWIKGYMKYVWLEERRKYTTRPKTQSWDDVQALKDTRINPEKGFDAEEVRFRAQRYYSKLPADYQTVVKLKFFDGLDGLEAAKRLAISHDMFRTRLCRAMKMLREFARGDDKEGRS